MKTTEELALLHRVSMSGESMPHYLFPLTELEAFRALCIADFVAGLKPLATVTREADKFNGHEPCIDWFYRECKAGTKLYTLEKQL